MHIDADTDAQMNTVIQLKIFRSKHFVVTSIRSGHQIMASSIVHNIPHFGTIDT